MTKKTYENIVYTSFTFSVIALLLTVVTLVKVAW